MGARCCEAVTSSWLRLCQPFERSGEHWYSLLVCICMTLKSIMLILAISWLVTGRHGKTVSKEIRAGDKEYLRWEMLRHTLSLWPTDSVDGSPNYWPAYRPSTRVQESCAIIFIIVRMGDYILLQSQNDCLELKFRQFAESYVAID